jgi:chitin synthase
MNRKSSANTLAHQRLEAATDLAQLPGVSDDLVVACLRERFMADSIYTNISSCALVALNPHKYVPSNADSVLHKYAQDHRDTSQHRDQSLPPHIFQLANNAYYHMRRTTQDQSILFW